MKPIYRADHVGSLLRPADVLAARQAVSEGRMELAALRALEDQAIEAVVRRQRDIGLDVVTDGEIRRGSWITDMAEAVEGFVREAVPMEWRASGGGVEVEASTAHVAGARLRKTKPLTGEEVPLLKRTAPGSFKVTLPAPSNFMLASYRPGITDRVYASREEFLAEIVGIIQDEVRWLASQGVTYIQFDAPFYSHYLDPRQREQMQRQGADPDQELVQAVAGDNAALNAIAPDVTRAMHVCRGNSRSRWYTEGGYDIIAERLLGQLAVDRFLLEYDDARSGGFEALRFVPKGKMVVLGLVTTKTGALESGEQLRRRIDQAAQVMPLELLAISPQCGFASVAAGNALSADEQWQKLQLIVDTARKVWGS